MFHFQQNCHLFCCKSNNNNFVILNRGTLFQNGLVQLLGKQDRCFVQTFLRVFSLGQPIPKNCSGTFFKNSFDLWQVQSCRRLYCHFTLNHFITNVWPKEGRKRRQKFVVVQKTLLDYFYFTLLMVKIEAFGTLVSCSFVIFFSPSKSKNDSKVGGAFIV